MIRTLIVQQLSNVVFKQLSGINRLSNKHNLVSDYQKYLLAYYTASNENKISERYNL